MVVFDVLVGMIVAVDHWFGSLLVPLCDSLRSSSCACVACLNVKSSQLVPYNISLSVRLSLACSFSHPVHFHFQ